MGVSDTPSPYKGEEYQGESGGEDEEEADPNAHRDNQDLAERFSVRHAPAKHLHHAVRRHHCTPLRGAIIARGRAPCVAPH